MARKLNTTHKVLIALGIFVFIVLIWFIATYNGLIRVSEGVETAWSQVENQYQRRADLIPNLVSTVKGYAAHEEGVFTQITAMRSQWAGAKTVPDQIQAARGMDSAIARLLLVAENYPDLKASQNFLALQAQLEGTENRIAVERMRYNEIVRTYNIKIKRIPTNIVAGMLGYEENEYFEADEGAEIVPLVEFE